jgi:uncharacterized protein (TIGR02453 family)
MQYFTVEYLNFFNELSKNNNKEWFDENRKRYMQFVREPFVNFTTDLIANISLDDNITMQAKDAMFRINRDIRFSKDKTPYKTNLSAIVTAMTRKDNHFPGFYFEIGKDGIMIAGGIYEAEKNNILSFRTYIANNIEEFQEIYQDEKFVKYFNKLLGEKNKLLPKEFKDLISIEPMIANKQIYYMAYLDKKHITSSNLIDTLMQYYYVAKPMKDFLTRAVTFM